MLVRLWGKVNPWFALLVGRYTGVSTMDNSMEKLKEVKTRKSLWSTHATTLGTYSKKTNTDLKGIFCVLLTLADFDLNLSPFIIFNSWFSLVIHDSTPGTFLTSEFTVSKFPLGLLCFHLLLKWRYSAGFCPGFSAFLNQFSPWVIPTRRIYPKLSRFII